MKIWKKFVKPDEKILKKVLSDEEFNVTQKNWTEYPFTGVYWNHKDEGIYVDKVSGEPLFSSTDKFISKCGWPSFTKSIEEDNLVKLEDYSNFMYRIEIRSKYGDTHLGHMFNDGPLPNGVRYCINSASIRFIPKNRLEEEGYGEYLKLFK